MTRASSLLAATGLLLLSSCGSDTGDAVERGPSVGAVESRAVHVSQGKCRPPLTNCGGKCVDLSTSHDNCGACKHHCPGGDFNWCTSGACRFGDHEVNCIMQPACPPGNCCYVCGGPGCGVVCAASPCG